VTDGHDRHAEVHGALAQVRHRVREGDQFLCLGDVSNPFSPGVHRAVALAVETAHAFEFACKDNAWIVGNHDVMEDQHGSHSLLGVKALEASGDGSTQLHDEPRVTWLGNYLLVSLPYVAPARSYDPAAWIEEACELADNETIVYPGRRKRTVVAGHLMIEGIEPGSETTDMARGRDVFWPEEAVRKHFPDALWLNGHYHRGQVFRGIHVPGSLVRVTHGEEQNQPRFLVFD